MPIFSIKPGVDLRGATPQLVIAVAVVVSVFTDAGYDAVLTSVCDSASGRVKGSRHKIGCAADFRIRHVTPLAQRRELRDAIAAALGPDFDVVLKGGRGPHLHIEWDPK